MNIYREIVLVAVAAVTGVGLAYVTGHVDNDPNLSPKQVVEYVPIPLFTEPCSEPGTYDCRVAAPRMRNHDCEYYHDGEIRMDSTCLEREKMRYELMLQRWKDRYGDN